MLGNNLEWREYKGSNNAIAGQQHKPHEATKSAANKQPFMRQPTRE
jgi:hypothetical protein